jgi:GNAT superfamily N-acetyltransferase
MIRPVCPADRPALRDFFAGLSVQTRYLRFFGPVTPTPALLDLLCGQAAGVHAVVAFADDGTIVGHAMAADQPEPGDRRDPGRDRTADIGVVVADAWQGRGVGSALMRALVGQAQARGVASLAMDVLHVNRQVLGMILGHWPVADIDNSRDSLDIRIRLAPRQPPQPSQPERLPAPPAARRARPLVTVGG